MHTRLHSRTAWPFVSVWLSCYVPAWLPCVTQDSRGPSQDFFTQFLDSAVNPSKMGKDKIHFSHNALCPVQGIYNLCDTRYPQTIYTKVLSCHHIKSHRKSSLTIFICTFNLNVQIRITQIFCNVQLWMSHLFKEWLEWQYVHVTSLIAHNPRIINLKVLVTEYKEYFYQGMI